jgi:FKBP-type peptidyl-prolyl cis-trans isomerase FklB
MKKLSFAVAFGFATFVIVSLFSCTAQTPKADLKTGLDSLSYAYGIAYSQGIGMFLEQQGITDSTKANFIEGLLEGSKSGYEANKKETARFLGREIGQQISKGMLPQINQQIFGGDSTKTIDKSTFIAGFLASSSKEKPLLSEADAKVYVEKQSAALREESLSGLKAKNQAFLDENKTKEGVITLPSGLQYKITKEGTGTKPTAEDTVVVNYSGKTIDGNVFDSQNEYPFPLNRVISGWTEGIQLMAVGAKYTFYIPYNLAYGEAGSGDKISPYATLIFDVDLLDVKKAANAVK